jgi:hypothetical protein
MSDNASAYKAVIADMQAKIADDEKALSVRKRMVNELAVSAGLSPIYTRVDVDSDSATPLAIKSDQFYGQPQATCVRVILQMRKALGQGPATINEIYGSLVEGGFAFETNNEENRKRGLRISVSKNTALFHKLPNGKIGLLEWYPNARKFKKGSAAAALQRLAAGEAGEGDADEDEGGAEENDL